MKPGDVVHLNWSPQSGNEMAHKHYGVVLSVEAFNKHLPRIVVAPITSKAHAEFGPLRVKVETTKKKIKGFICLDHIRSLDPAARGVELTKDELTVDCRTQCKTVIKKIFGV